VKPACSVVAPSGRKMASKVHVAGTRERMAGWTSPSSTPFEFDRIADGAYRYTRGWPNNGYDVPRRIRSRLVEVPEFLIWSAIAVVAKMPSSEKRRFHRYPSFGPNIRAFRRKVSQPVCYGLVTPFLFQKVAGIGRQGRRTVYEDGFVSRPSVFVPIKLRLIPDIKISQRCPEDRTWQSIYHRFSLRAMSWMLL